MGGFGGGELGGGTTQGDVGPKSEQSLTALWLDFELHSPGRQPQTIRREIMDVRGPAARASRANAKLDESAKLPRALALLSQVEILPLVGDLSPEFVTHLAAKAFLSKREVFSRLAAPGHQPTHEEASLVEDALAQMPGPLYTLALERVVLTPDRYSRFLDRPNIFCLLTRFKASGSDAITQQSIVDLANNDVAARTRPNAGPFAAQLEQGIVDSVAEANGLLAHDSDPGSLAAFTHVASLAKELTIVRTRGDDGWRRITVSDDARARMEEDLRAGYMVVAPDAPIDINGTRQFGWWRVNPTSGETLGVMENGFHQGGTEDTLIRRQPVNGELVEDISECLLAKARSRMLERLLEEAAEAEFSSKNPVVFAAILERIMLQASILNLHIKYGGKPLC